MGNDIWLNDNDYPDPKDVEKFGYDSPPDNDPLTIGYIGDVRPAFWTARHIGILIVALILIGALVLPWLLRLLF